MFCGSRRVSVFAPVIAVATLASALVLAPTEKSFAAACSAAGAYAGGTGSSIDPYQISSPQELAKLSQDSQTSNLTDKNYKLTADIDLAGCDWTPIGQNAPSSNGFAGTFDGDGHVIKNLSVSDSDTTSSNNAGLFGYVRAISTGASSYHVAIRDVGVENAVISSGRKNVGIVAGNIQGGYTGVWATGSVTGGSSVGGLFGSVNVGWGTAPSTDNSYVIATVTATNPSGNSQAAGFVDSNNAGNRLTSYTVATVTSTGGTPKGFGGYSATVPGFGTPVSSFYDSTVSGLTDTGRGDPKTTAELTTFSTFDSAGWDIVEGWEAYDPAGGKVWGISTAVNDGYPFLLHQFDGAITFDSNGGSGSMAVLPGNPGDTLTANGFSRSGYTFSGWNSAADGSGTDYADSATFPFSGATTLYAQWEVVPSPSGSSSSPAPANPLAALLSGSLSSFGTGGLVAPTPSVSTNPTPVLTGVQDTPMPTALQAYAGKVPYIGRQPVPSTLVSANNSLTVGVGKLGLSVQAMDAHDSAKFDGTGNLLITEGAEISFAPSGLWPGSPVQVFFGRLGAQAIEVTADQNGTVDFTLTEKMLAGGAGALPVGSHRIQVTAYDEDGNLVAIDMIIQIAQRPVSPVLDPSTGMPPQLAPGSVSGFSGSQKLDVQVSAFPDSNIVSLTAGQSTFAIKLDEESQFEGSEDAAIVSPDSIASLTGGSLMPGTTASVWLYPGEIYLGQTTVGEDGSFELDFLFDSLLVTGGSYTLQIQGVSEEGLPQAVNLGITVASAEESPEFAGDGALRSPMLFASALSGLALAGLVFWLILFYRRRSQGDSTETR